MVPASTIFEAVAAQMGIRPDEIWAQGDNKALFTARLLAVLALRRHGYRTPAIVSATGRSSNAINRYFNLGNWHDETICDHLTAILARLPARERDPDPNHISGATFDDVLRAVEAETGLSARQIRGPRQDRSASRSRQLAFYVMRTHLSGASLPAVGYFMGRDHTTVLYGARVAERNLRADHTYRSAYNRVITRLHGRYHEIRPGPSVRLPHVASPCAGR